MATFAVTNASSVIPMLLARTSNPAALNLFRAFALFASRLRCVGVTNVLLKSLVLRGGL